MKAKWVGLLVVAAALAALLVYKQGSKPPATPTAAVTNWSEQSPAVLLFADPREAEAACGCGQIIRLVRDASTQGVHVQEIAPDSGDERIQAHRIVVNPTVIILDADESEIARHEGEDAATIAAIRADLDELVQETR